jgi:hypothetical protein
VEERLECGSFAASHVITWIPEISSSTNDHSVEAAIHGVVCQRSDYIYKTQLASSASTRSYTMTKRPRESDATEAGPSAVGDSEQVLLKAPQVCPPPHIDASYLDLADASI